MTAVLKFLHHNLIYSRKTFKKRRPLKLLGNLGRLGPMGYFVHMLWTL